MVVSTRLKHTVGKKYQAKIQNPNQNGKRARCPRFGAAARREEEEYPLWIFDRRATQQQPQRSGNPEGCFLAGAWRRCSSVRERCGYLPSSRLASRLPKNSAPISHSDLGSITFPAKLSWRAFLNVTKRNNCAS
jgi:hypothetical protein